MDRVDVDEKWFNDETFKIRRYLLLKGEEALVCTVRHKKQISKVMFLFAQARPRYDPHRKHVWDGKLAMILIGHWVKVNRTSKYYKKGDLKWRMSILKPTWKPWKMSFRLN